VRAVLDPNIVISALLSPGRAPAKVLSCWIEGGYDLVISPLLLAELDRALSHPTIRARVSEVESAELIEILRRSAWYAEDPPDAPTVHSADSGDDYLIALAALTRSVLVSGDHHILDLKDHLPIYSPSDFLEDVLQ
jgi:putative PIN family toxin of toxin-antitoxin system